MLCLGQKVGIVQRSCCGTTLSPVRTRAPQVLLTTHSHRGGVRDGGNLKALQRSLWAILIECCLTHKRWISRQEQPFK